MEIAFKKTKLVALKDLQEFQGELKELTKDNYDKLYKQIKKKFTMPFAVWEDKDGIIHMLDGHQRKHVLNEMISQGEDIPDKFPCNFIEAESEREAKEILLSFVSQYGQITDEGLAQFVTDAEFDADMLKENFNIPGLDLDVFCNEHFNNQVTKHIEEKREKLEQKPFKSTYILIEIKPEMLIDIQTQLEIIKELGGKIDIESN